MKGLITTALCLLIVGCGHNPTRPVTQIETVTVHKAVYRVPDTLRELPVIERPKLAMDAVAALPDTDELTLDQMQVVMNAYLTTVIQLRTYSQKLESNQQVIQDLINQPEQDIPETTRSVHTVEQ